MNTQIQPYLFFGGHCEEALEFYKTALGAKVEMLMRYTDCPDEIPAGRLSPGFENKVMHVTFQIAGNTLMASDGCGEKHSFEGFSLSLALPTEAEAYSAFSALAGGGEITMPLTKTFWSPCFGMLSDRFGLGWMITVAAECGK